MTITAEQAAKLLEGKLEGIKLAYSSNGEGVIYIAPTENRDSAVAIPVRDKNMGWHKANPEVYMALIDRFNAAPDLARALIASEAARKLAEERLAALIRRAHDVIIRDEKDGAVWAQLLADMAREIDNG